MALSPAQIGLAALGGVAAIAGAVILGPRLMGPENAPDPVVEEQVVETTETTTEPAAAAVLTPVFDVVRIPANGYATIAGTTSGGADVSIMIDGADVKAAQADGNGQFVSFFEVVPSDTPREMTMVAKLGDQMSDISESVIIAPSEATDPTILKADEDGVEVLQQAGTLPGELRIDAITYDEAGNVFASGRATGGKKMLLYVDNALAGDVFVGADGQWRSELKDLAAGTYTLRADLLDADGSVNTRAELEFEREVIQAAAGEAEEPKLKAVEVVPGSTLWQIAVDNYGDGLLYVRLYDANKQQITDPDLIYPGQVFVIPEE